MHTVMDIQEYARFFYKTDKPTKSQVNIVSRKCRDGSIKNAQKMGSKWFIDCTSEWPTLFPEEQPKPKVVYVEREPRITADMRLGDALAMLLDALLEEKEKR